MPKLVFLADEAGVVDESVQLRLKTVLEFLAEQLVGNYFGGDRISLTDVTVGSVLPLLRRTGGMRGVFPSLELWCDRVSDRPAWQRTEPSEAELEVWRRWVGAMVKRRQRRGE